MLLALTGRTEESGPMSMKWTNEDSNLEEQEMWSNKSLVIVSLVVFVFLGGRAFAECPSADISGDCRVDLEDFAIMASQWLDDGREEVPNVVGMTQSSAEAAITGAGLTVGTVTEEYNNTVPVGDVISQNPVAGVLLLPGGAVNLVVSLGPEVDITWVSINDPGVPGHEGFTGEMSKYETTNAQYCAFLNAAGGLITVYNNVVYATSDTGHLEPYFDIYTGGSSYSQITYSGGVFSVRSRDSYSMANHPVVYVSWYGATAFCNYYGYRLPTEWEWQAVADHTVADPYIYGCGTTIDQTKANYYDNDYANPLGLSSVPYTSPVNHYSSYGYWMNDMAGNVWEWTSTVSGSFRVIRGGGWATGGYCVVSYRCDGYPDNSDCSLGFRVCR